MGKATKVSEEELEGILKLYESGTSLKVIAQTFNISVPTAGRYVRLAGGTVRGRGRPKGSTAKPEGPPNTELPEPLGPYRPKEDEENSITIDGKPAVANLDW